MRYRPARYRNGYHRTLTRAQRRNRWLLTAGLVLLVGLGGRCSAKHDAPDPTPAIRVA